jgi:hypothetical protein
VLKAENPGRVEIVGRQNDVTSRPVFFDLLSTLNTLEK